MADPVSQGFPPDALVLLVGPSGSGKSTWAAARFAPEVILSSDAFRAAIAGDAADQTATRAAFGALHAAARARLGQGALTVVDATNLTERARRPLLRLAAGSDRPTVAVAFDVPLARCLAQNRARPDRQVPEVVVRRHHHQMQQALVRLPTEGYVRIERIGDEQIPGG